MEEQQFQPGDGIVERYAPHLDGIEREHARERLRALLRLVIRIEMRIARDAMPNADSHDVDPGSTIQISS